MTDRVEQKLIDGLYGKEIVTGLGFDNLFNNISDINWQDHDGWTILMAASRQNKTSFIPKILDKMENIDHQTESGNTALMGAAMYNYIEIVELLVNHGANINIKNNKGNSPLSEALSKEVKNILISKKQGWKIVSDNEVAYVEFKLPLNMKVTEMFNFHSPSNPVVTTIIQNLETDMESHSIKDMFKYHNKERIRDAFNHTNNLSSDKFSNLLSGFGKSKKGAAIKIL